MVLVALVGCDQLFGLDKVHHPDAPPADGPPPEYRWRSVVAGERHSCAIRDDQTLWCWGRNDQGQLGLNRATVEQLTPAQIGTETWTQLSAGTFHTCGIKVVDQSLWCWGESDTGRLGFTTTSDVFTPTKVATPAAWKLVSAGASHTCAIDVAGAMWCWGDDRSGALGDDNVGADKLVPTAVSTASASGPWVKLATADQATCGIDAVGALWCWGANNYGESGVLGSSVYYLPTRVGAGTWSHVAAGQNFRCGIETSGALSCWGRNQFGQLGNSTTNSAGTPASIAGTPSTWIDLALGSEHVCARRADESLWCWGSNEYGQFATDTGTDAFRSSPTASAAGPWSGIGTGSWMTCAIDVIGTLSCAGLAANGQLGSPPGGSQALPVQIGTGRTWTKVATGTTTTCAISSGTLWCWGGNTNGSVGDGTGGDRQQPVQVGTASNWTTVSVGNHVCATNASNELWCWGTNDVGGLGDGTTVDRLAPVPIGAAMWKRVTAFDQHTCAIDTSDARHCWGSNYQGESGQPASIMGLTSPFALGGSAQAMTLGDSHSCSLALDGMSITCWGYNGLGELGDGSTVSRYTQASANYTGGPFVAITAGLNHTCAVSSTGNAFCSGSDAYGQFGRMTVSIVVSSPVQVPGSWLALSGGGGHNCGIRMGGTMWCMGRGSRGQLGAGTFDELHSPVQVGMATTWTQVSSGDSHTCGLQGGDLWCWGSNRWGQIGDGTAWRTALQAVTP